MGKILIIKGVALTPPSSGSDPVNPGPDVPPATSAEYVIYYLDASNMWYRSRAAATTIKAVGIVVGDTRDSDITGVNSALPADTPQRKLLFIAENAISRGDSFVDDQNLYATADALQSSNTLPSNARSLLIWLDDHGADLTSSRVDAIVNAAGQYITFVH